VKEYLKLPRINGRTDGERVSQIVSFLYQTVQQLNFVLSSLEGKQETVKSGLTEKERSELMQEVRKMIREATAGEQTGGTT
jgi:hypothetical protein